MTKLFVIIGVTGKQVCVALSTKHWVSSETEKGVLYCQTIPGFAQLESPGYH